MEPNNCVGHSLREDRRQKIKKLHNSELVVLDENLRLCIKKGPVSVETSLRELEENYESKAEWKVIEQGGVLSVPVEEFRMINPPKPDRKGNVKFDTKKSERGGRHIENYPVGQSIANLTALIVEKFTKVRNKAKTGGKSEASAERGAEAEAMKLPELQAVQKWQDNVAEIELKKALEKMMEDLGISSLIIRSINLKALFALKDLGFKFPEDAEVDLMMAYASGDFLHVVIFEVKRADIYPWQSECKPPNKQAVNKAENQLTKDVDVLMAILAGIPPSQIIFKTLAIFCPRCLDTGIVSQEDLADLSLLQKKTQVPDKPDLATTSGKKKLLTLTARLLSSQSLLHIGYREVEDKERLVTERHRYNLETVDMRVKQREFVIASPQQQEVIGSFTASKTKRHLVLEGPAGTGKTLVALQVAKNLMESAPKGCYHPLPVLVVTTQERCEEDPIMKYLDSRTNSDNPRIFKMWRDIGKNFEEDQGYAGPVKGGYTEYTVVKKFPPPAKAKQISWSDQINTLAKTWEGRQIVLLMDEIMNKELLRNMEDTTLPESVRIVMVLNPDAFQFQSSPLTLPDSYLHVTLTTPYRSTIAITRLARFIAKCKGLAVPEGDFGSDVEGSKPIYFNVGEDVDKLEKALRYCRGLLGEDVTLLYSDAGIPLTIMDTVKTTGGPWDCCHADRFFGWEAERVVAVTSGERIMELITRWYSW